jgi:hypothetical protein
VSVLELFIPEIPPSSAKVKNMSYFSTPLCLVGVVLS